MLGHVAFIHDGHPYCVPMLYAQVDDKVYVHGSTASRLVRALSEGVSACMTVTIVRGLVLARSAFEHSANYDSVMLFGTFKRIVDSAERLAAFEAFTNTLVPGRWAEVRGPTRKELKATAILSLEIEEASGKSRTGGPEDDDSLDARTDTWAGVLPIGATFGDPVPASGLRPDIALAPSVRRMLARGTRQEATPYRIPGD